MFKRFRLRRFHAALVASGEQAISNPQCEASTMAAPSVDGAASQHVEDEGRVWLAGRAEGGGGHGSRCTDHR